MKIIHLCLCGSYNENWGYQDNMLAKYHKMAGNNVTVITSIFTDSLKRVGYEKVSPGEYFENNGVKVIRLAFKKSIFPIQVIQKLRLYEGLYQKIVEEKPDLIFVHGIQFLDLDVIGKYKRNFPNCRIIADNHASYENSGKNFISKIFLHKTIFRKSISKNLNYLEKIFAITPSCKKFAKDMYRIPNDKFDYLYLGADTELIKEINKDYEKMFKKKYNIPFESKVIITGGKLSKSKNVDLLIEVFNKFSDEFYLVIFGEFSQDIKETMLNLIKTNKRIIYLGWTDSKNVYKLYSASDIAIFLGTQSALWQQAIGCGLPIITKKWDSIEYLDVGGNCEFINTNDTGIIAQKILDILKDPKRLENMKKIASTKGYEKFSYESIAKYAIK